MSAAWGPSEAWLRGWCAGQVAARVWVLLAELGTDPYDPEEEDPAMSRALESSLWELQVGTPPPGPTRTPLSCPNLQPTLPPPPTLPFSPVTLVAWKGWGGDAASSWTQALAPTLAVKMVGHSAAQDLPYHLTVPVQRVVTSRVPCRLCSSTTTQRCPGPLASSARHCPHPRSALHRSWDSLRSR